MHQNRWAKSTKTIRRKAQSRQAFSSSFNSFVSFYLRTKTRSWKSRVLEKLLKAFESRLEPMKQLRKSTKVVHLRSCIRCCSRADSLGAHAGCSSQANKCGWCFRNWLRNRGELGVHPEGQLLKERGNSKLEGEKLEKTLTRCSNTEATEMRCVVFDLSTTTDFDGSWCECWHIGINCCSCGVLRRLSWSRCLVWRCSFLWKFN
jgi:hypothetical protein